MRQEDKELLLKELSGRLPFGVKIKIGEHSDYKLIGIVITDEHPIKVEVIENGIPYKIEVSPDIIKPYLRSLETMTEEEIEELKTLCSIYIPTDSPTIGFEDYGTVVFTHHLTNNTYSFKLNLDVIDWLNANHFDYRGMIKKGLAIEITKENNPYK